RPSRSSLFPYTTLFRSDRILAVLVCYRLLSPGSEWRLHREWFLRSALADLLGGDFSLAEEHRLYECHDRLLAHKGDLFASSRSRSEEHTSELQSRSDLV